MYLSEQALEDTVKQVKAPRILHLATHGFFLEEQDRSAWRSRRAGGSGMGPGIRFTGGRSSASESREQQRLRG